MQKRSVFRKSSAALKGSFRAVELTVLDVQMRGHMLSHNDHDRPGRSVGEVIVRRPRRLSAIFGAGVTMLLAFPPSRDVTSLAPRSSASAVARPEVSITQPMSRARFDAVSGFRARDPSPVTADATPFIPANRSVAPAAQVADPTTAPANANSSAPAPAPLCSTQSPYTDAVFGGPAPVGYWRLGDPTGVLACDSAGSSNGTYRHGYALGQPTLIADDPDAASRLDGAMGYVNIPSTDAINPSGSFTVEAWVRPAELAVSQTVVRKHGQFLLRLYSDTVFFRVWWDDGTYTELTSGAVMRPDAIQHLVASFDGSTMRLYRNGHPIASQSSIKTPATSTNPLLLGQSGGYDYFSGHLDEIALYPTALSPAVVSFHSLAGRGGPDTSPPAPPTSLAATGGHRFVTLAWDDSPDLDVQFYRVFRRQAGTDWSGPPIGTSPSRHAVDSDLVAGITYEYRVTAVDLSGHESSHSSSVQMTVRAAPPGPTKPSVGPS